MAAAKTVLISGASIAGPALAFWLHRYGFEVTVVERAPTVRSGGYPIDVRGTAMEVIRRFGLLSEIKAAHVFTERYTFVDRRGRTVGSIKPEELAGGQEGVDVEVAREELTAMLYAKTRSDVRYVFNDSIESLEDTPGGVEIKFASGAQQRFDIVVGADGLHSRTRGLVFGPEEQFDRYLGFCFAGFSLPNTFGLKRESTIYNLPRKMAAIYAAGDSDQVFVLMAVARSKPSAEQMRDVAAQRRLMAEAFAGDGWELPGLIGAMGSAQDLFFDTVSQIRMPRWSAGRVALVGDAAYGPSFLSGQGSSLALVGAYALAGSLAVEPDHGAAFSRYETETRGFVERNQGLVNEGSTAMIPKTAAGLWMRNRFFQAAPLLRRLGLMGGDKESAIHSGLQLSDYGPLGDAA